MNDYFFKEKEFKDLLDTLIKDENSIQLTDEEQAKLNEVIELLEDFDKKIEALNEAKAKGATHAQWMGHQLKKSVDRIAKTEEEQNKLLNVIDSTIEQTLINQAGEEAES